MIYIMESFCFFFYNLRKSFFTGWTFCDRMNLKIAVRLKFILCITGRGLAIRKPEQQRQKLLDSI